MHQEIKEEPIQPGHFKAIKANDKNALKDLYLKNFYKTEDFVLKNNGTSEQAKDIFQEAFIVVWRNIQLNKFYPENETSLSGYLFTIARNKWLDYLRSAQYKKIISLNDADILQKPFETITEEENNNLAAIKSNFNNLGDKCKELLTAFYYNKLSLKKIAGMFGWTEATAKNNKYRCIQRLKEMINKKHFE